MLPLAGTIVDWAALGKVVLFSFAGALLLTTLFTAGVLLVEDGESHHAGVASRIAGAAAFTVCLGLVAFALSVLFDK